MTTSKLTKENKILFIIKNWNKMTKQELAHTLDITRPTLDFWASRLRGVGHKLENKSEKIDWNKFKI
jgi:predicted HTH transcriptional regulator